LAELSHPFGSFGKLILGDSDRLGECRTFNTDESIPLFLISLHAGGTGLNLTGADMVVHFDPWWNPAVEDQATDRAHRIGQKRKVEVIRLVTHASIEEQVVALGQRKKALFDQLITPGEELVTALTEQDIRALFA
jgi:SNF2 family DNA or RNA helicase